MLMLGLRRSSAAPAIARRAVIRRQGTQDPKPLPSLKGRGRGWVGPLMSPPSRHKETNPPPTPPFQGGAKKTRRYFSRKNCSSTSDCASRRNCSGRVGQVETATSGSARSQNPVASPRPRTSRPTTQTTSPAPNPAPAPTPAQPQHPQTASARPAAPQARSVRTANARHRSTARSCTRPRGTPPRAETRPPRAA